MPALSEGLVEGRRALLRRTGRPTRGRRHEVASTLAGIFPRLGNDHRRAAECWYTLTPDENFVIGAHPVSDRVLLACGFSGHGFKFTPVVGEVLADLVVDGATPVRPVALRPAALRVVRLFVALRPPPDAVAHADTALEPVRREHPDLRWVPAQRWHLTLAFYGEIPDDKVEGTVAMVDRRLRGHGPCDLAFRGAGSFTRRALWLGVDGDLAGAEGDWPGR